MKSSSRKICVAVMLMFVVIMAVGCKSDRKQLSIAKYIMVNVEGLSGRATAKVYLDTQGIYSSLAGLDASQTEKDVYKGFVESLNVSASGLEQLANNDVITVTVTYDAELADELKLSVTDFIKNVTVTGLNEGTEIDVFKDLKLIVSGVAPYAFLTYENCSQDPYIKGLEYEIIGDVNNLSNGDKITIKCNLDPKTAELYYYYTDVTSMEYVVEGLDSYVYDTADIDYNILNEIAAECAQVIYDDTNDTTTRMMYTVSGNTNYLYQDNNEWVDLLKLNQVIFMTKNNGSIDSAENRLYYVFKAGVCNHNYYEEAYFIFEYANAIVAADGTFMIGRNNPELRYVCGVDFDALYNELTRDFIAGYNAVILDGVVWSE